MKALLEDEVAARLKELLEHNDQSTPLGYLQYEACRTTLLNGNLLVVKVKPGGFPLTYSLPVKRG